MLIMLMTLPISIASSYTFLLADDWSEGVSKVDVSFGELIMLSIVNVKTYYLNWLGTYSAKFEKRVRTKSWTTIGLRKDPFYVFKRTKGYGTTDISSNQVCN